MSNTAILLANARPVTGKTRQCEGKCKQIKPVEGGVQNGDKWICFDDWQSIIARINNPKKRK